MRATGSIRTSISIGLVVVASLFLVTCESADKAPAAVAISAAQSALDSIKGEAAKYVPSQVGAAESAIASAQDAAAKTKDLAAAAAAKKAELAKTWEDMSGGLPKMAEAIKSRVDILSQRQNIPAGPHTDNM